MAHLGTPNSIPDYSQNLSILFKCICIDSRLFARAAKSSAYAAELTVIFDVPNVYQFCPFCSHRNSGSKNIINKYGLSVSPCIVPLCIGIGFVFPKYSLVNIVLDCE